MLRLLGLDHGDARLLITARSEVVVQVVGKFSPLMLSRAISMSSAACPGPSRPPAAPSTGSDPSHSFEHEELALLGVELDRHLFVSLPLVPRGASRKLPKKTAAKSRRSKDQIGEQDGEAAAGRSR